MKKWQKIAGVTLFGVIGAWNLLIWLNALVDFKYFILDVYGKPDVIERMYMRADSLSMAMGLNYFVALFLFVCLWRKGSRNTE